jgi:hypothetical protein
MAATDARPWPIKNQAFRVSFPIFKNDGTVITGATALDSEVSKDAGTFADCTNEATEIATASGHYYLDLTASEMNADTVVVQVKTTSTGAVVTSFTFYPIDLKEPSAVPGFSGAAGIEEALAWVLAMARNKRTVTASTHTLRNDADNANIATSTVSDDGTTFTSGEWS